MYRKTVEINEDKLKSLFKNIENNKKNDNSLYDKAIDDSLIEIRKIFKYCYIKHKHSNTYICRLGFHSKKSDLLKPDGSQHFNCYGTNDLDVLEIGLKKFIDTDDNGNKFVNIHYRSLDGKAHQFIDMHTRDSLKIPLEEFEVIYKL